MLREGVVSASDTPALWCADALRFECTLCGRCCSGAPGYVWVTPDDIDRLAAHLRLTPSDFQQRHTRRLGYGISLLERPNGDCEFLRRLDDGTTRCTIHALRRSSAAPGRSGSPTCGRRSPGSVQRPTAPASAAAPCIRCPLLRPLCARTATARSDHQYQPTANRRRKPRPRERRVHRHVARRRARGPQQPQRSHQQQAAGDAPP